MNLEEFRKIKNEMFNIFNRFDEIEKSNVRYEDIEDEAEKLQEKYHNLMNILLNNDLSKIPFIEWNGMTLFVEKELDLSKTHANIDFSLLKETSYETINLKGCNVKGIKYINYDNNTFDEQFINNNSSLFPNKNLSQNIIDKFYNKELEFEDLLNYPSLKTCVTEYSFGNNYQSSSGSLVSSIGLDKALAIFEENPEFIVSITKKQNDYSNLKYDFNYIIKNKNTSIEDIKRIIYQEVIIGSTKYGYKFPSIEIIPEDMKKMFPQIFVDSELPKIVAEHYYSGNLTFDEIKQYRDILINKNIEVGLNNILGYREIKKNFGDIWSFLDKVPFEVTKIVANYLSLLNNEELNESKNISTDELITKAIRKIVLDTNNINTLDEIGTYIKYIPIEELIPNETIRNFINRVGITNLQNYNRKNNYILDRNGFYETNMETSIYGLLSKYFDNSLNNNENINKFSIEDILNKTMTSFRVYSDYSDFTKLYEHKKELSTLFPNQFLNYNKIEELLNEFDENNKDRIVLLLEKGLNGDIESLLNIINKYPELTVLFKDKDLLFKKNLSSKYKQLYEKIGNNLFLEIGSKYGLGLSVIINDISDDNFEDLLIILSDMISNKRNYDNFLNDTLYNSLTSNRNFDIRCLPENFKFQHPDLYLKENAPSDLADVFYGNNHSILGGMHLISFRDIYTHPEWISYLEHIDLSKSIEEVLIDVYNSKKGDSSIYILQHMSLVEALSTKFSNKEILEFISKYGEILDDYLSIDFGLEKEDCYKDILKNIYNKIISRKTSCNLQLFPEEFKLKYPDIFLDNNVPEELKNLFYQRKISPEIIQIHPEWANYLTDKNIFAMCNFNIKDFVSDIKRIRMNNDTLFKMFIKYGEYLTSCNVRLGEKTEDIDLNIKNQIANSIIQKRTKYDESAKKIIGDIHPELFLDNNAPAELKECFYNYSSNNPLTFELLKQHKEWLPFLIDKNVLLSLKKRNVGVSNLEILFNKYGSFEALRIGMKNPESVMKMLADNKVELLFKWYDKLNFIPNYIVMTEFPIEDSDKFITSGKKWSQLMRLESYNLNDESLAALLKASKAFGVFDNDSEGFNKIIQLFAGIPKYLSESEMDLMINNFTIDGELDESKNTELILLKKSYRKNNDGGYDLIINTHQNKEIVEILLKTFQRVGLKKVLNPDTAHKLFGGFEMKYDPSFRDFILKNMDYILESEEYIAYISSMQKHWDEIKALNSNRVLTLDLALACVKNNSYENVQLGNERLADVSNQAGYSQKDFDLLQQIYNYGKMRTFNSIPRIKTSIDQYTYEILRLDDPLAIAIGTLTDCCQELGNAAETCMEHSMVDKHGRIFVIKDHLGNIVAQSWMWRNQNTICFDNIEIPAKAFTRAEKNGSSREDFTDTIFKLYQQAGQELIKKDESSYKKLYEEGKITEEQYQSIKLAKVTVGIGYNDIAQSLKKNATIDENIVARPLDFTPPVPLSHSLYTSDSVTQYVISGDSNLNVSNTITPTIYQDEFEVYDDHNTKQIDALALEKLEYITKKDSFLNTRTDVTTNIVTSIAYNYNLNSNNTKIIRNANFAIIYDVEEKEIIIGDLFYNIFSKNTDQTINNSDKVIMQIRMALDQISVDGKSFNIKRLNQEQKDIFNKAMNLNEQIDLERGLSYGTR